MIKYQNFNEYLDICTRTESITSQGVQCIEYNETYFKNNIYLESFYIIISKAL
jgi:hypothetical protein